MKLVVQLPALNEARTITQVLQAIPRSLPGVDEVRLVVVDDGSTDRTGELARQAGAIVVRHAKPRGVGAAFRSGLRCSDELGADIIVTIDADGQFDPADIPKLVGPILRGEAEFVTASRFVDPAIAPAMPWVKRWGNDMIAQWLSKLMGQRFYDVSCGFRAYSKDAFFRLLLLGEFTYTHEAFLNIAFAGLRIQEVPIVVRGTREHGKSRVANNVLRYAQRSAAIILKTYRDYRPLLFFTKIAAVLVLVGFGFLAFLAYVKIHTGQFTPHKWAGFVAAAFAGAGLTVFLLGIVAEMLDRIRAGQEEILYKTKCIERLLREQPAPGHPPAGRTPPDGRAG